MTSARSFLGRALVISLLLHAAAIAAVAQLVAPARQPARPAQAELTVLFHRVEVPDAPQNASAAAPRSPVRSRRESPVLSVAPDARQAAAAPQLSGEAARSAAEQLQRELPYPPEAIERGLQGEALVLLFLDQSGNVIAARLESSSGHALLDDAAVRAARTLHALPASAPREALLPVRFRLR